VQILNNKREQMISLKENLGEGHTLTSKVEKKRPHPDRRITKAKNLNYTHQHPQSAQARQHFATCGPRPLATSDHQRLPSLGRTHQKEEGHRTTHDPTQQLGRNFD